MDLTHRHSRHKHTRHGESEDTGVDLGLDTNAEIPIRHSHRFPITNLAILLLTASAAVGSIYWVLRLQRATESSADQASAVARPESLPGTAEKPVDPTSLPAAEYKERFGGSDSATGPQVFVDSDNPYAISRSPETATTIDEIVLNRLEELEITPARICSDAVFLRRVYIGTLGTIPTVEEARRFLDDPSLDKRARLVDELMNRPEFADYAAMKWCDILRVKAEFPIKLWPNAAQAYHYWVRTAIEENMPYDEFVYQLLTSSGSNFRTPQVNFYRAVQDKEPHAVAQAVALTFLCQRTDTWPASKLEGMARFFTRVGYKPTGEWKEEIVFFDRRKKLSEAEQGPLEATFPDGETVTIPHDADPRVVFAEWLTDKHNRAFSRAIANRIWYWLYGRGIVEEPDDMRSDNPPIHPELLDFLADELVNSDYDLRRLYRLILNSQTYQLSCVPESDDSQAGRYFAYFPTRRLDAEVLIDIICKITNTTEVYSSIIPEPFTFLPDGQRAVALPDGSITSSFLEMFGRPARDTGLESERNNRLSAAQALHMLNSNHIRNKLKEGSAILDLLRGSGGVENIYLGILSRRPTDDEYSRAIGMSVYGPTRDLAWALINSDEFLFQH